MIEIRNKATSQARAKTYSLSRYSRRENSVWETKSLVSKVVPQYRHFRATALIRFPHCGHAFSSPTVHPVSGMIFIGSQGNTVQAVGPDGSGRWIFKSKGDCDATPALIDDSTLAVGCDDGYLYALGTSDGALKWQVASQRRRPVRSSPAVDAAAGRVIFGADDGQITAVKLDGSVAWRHATGGPVRSSPVVDPAGRIVVGSQDDHVYALDRAGKLLWRVELGGDVDSSVAVGPGALYVGADDGNLYALTVKP